MTVILQSYCVTMSENYQHKYFFTIKQIFHGDKFNIHCISDQLLFPLMLAVIR